MNQANGDIQPLAASLTMGKIGLLPDVARAVTPVERPLNVELGDLPLGAWKEMSGKVLKDFLERTEHRNVP